MFSVIIMMAAFIYTQKNILYSCKGAAHWLSCRAFHICQLAVSTEYGSPESSE